MSIIFAQLLHLSPERADFLPHLCLLLTDDRPCCLALVITAAFKGIDHATHLAVLFRQGLVSHLQFANEGLQVEAIAVSWVLALGNANKLLYLVNFREKLLVLAVNEVDLTLLALDFLFSALLIESLAHSNITRLVRGYDLEAFDLFVTEAHFLIEKEDIVLKVRVELLELAKLLFEGVAAVICAPQLLSPHFLLTLIGAKLSGTAASARTASLIVLSEGMRELETTTCSLALCKRYSL